MQTTLRLDDALYRQAKARAAELGMSLTAFLEESLRKQIDQATESRPQKSIRLPVSKSKGGLLPRFRSLVEAIAAADLEDDVAKLRR